MSRLLDNMATMPNNATLAESAKLRERGNNLFSAGNLVAGELPSRFVLVDFHDDRHPRTAKAAYINAFRLAPRDPVPLVQLAAVGYKMGKHFTAAFLYERALELVQTQHDDALKQVICRRLARAYFFCGMYTKSSEATSKITNRGEKNELERSFSSMDALNALCPDEAGL